MNDQFLHNPNHRFSRPLFYLVIAEISLIFFLIPAGRFHASFFGLPFSVGGDVYKNFPILIFTWLLWRFFTPKKEIPQTLLHFPFLFLIFISILSSLGSHDPYQAFSETLELILYYLFFLVLIDIPWSKPSLFTVSSFFLAGNLWMGWTALNQYWMSGQSEGIPGLNATFNFPNTLGLYSILGFAFFVLMLLYSKDRFQKIGASTGIALVLIGGLVSLSRATYLGWMLMIFFVIFRERRLLKISPVFLGVFMCVGVVVFPYVSQKFAGVSQELQGFDDTSRIRVWPFVLDFSVPELSFFGYGKGPVLRDRMDSALVSTTESFFLTRHWKPHNLIMSLFLYMGLMGVIAFAWLLFAFWKEMQDCSRVDRTILYASLIGYFVHQLFDLHLLDGNIPAAFFGLMALGTWLSKNRPGEDQLLP